MINDTAGVDVTIEDQSQTAGTLVPNYLLGCAAIKSQKGLINYPYWINDKREREYNFGKKDYRKYGTTAHSADVYLSSGYPMMIIRAGDDACRLGGVSISDDNGTLSIAAFSTGKTQAELNTFVTDEKYHIYARGEGTWGNVLTITITAASADVYATGDSARVSTIVIKDGTTVVETHIVSTRQTDTNDKGVSIYVGDVIPRDSYYVGISIEDSYVGETQLVAVETTFAGGVDVTTENFDAALSTVIDYPDTYDIFVAWNAGSEITPATFAAHFATDSNALGICPVSLADATSAVASMTGDYSYNNKFVVTEDLWVLIEESESGQSVYVDSACFRAYAIATNNINSELAKAPAGRRRGNVVGALGLSKTRSGSDRVTLRDEQYMNSIIKSNKGTCFWEEITSQVVKSSFSDIHSVISFLVQKRGIKDSLDGFEFEFNDQDTVDQILTILREAASYYVLNKFAEEIIVDDENNVIGDDEINIRWNIRFKGVARYINVKVIAYPTTQSLSISMED